MQTGSEVTSLAWSMRMPCAASRAELAALLETAPAMANFSVASASMKRLTVEPEPTPMTAPSGT